MVDNKKTLENYNEHVVDIHKLVQDTYGVECHVMAYAITTNLISPSLLVKHLTTGEPVPDPEYVMFSVAKDLKECKIVKETFSDYLHGLLDQTKLHKVLDEAMELTENAGFGDIEQ